MVYSFFLSFVHSVIHSLIPLFIQSIFIISVYSLFRLLICYLVHTVYCTQDSGMNEQIIDRETASCSFIILFVLSFFGSSVFSSFR